MTQFKFVGGPSRKRRRRNEPKPAPAPATRESSRTARKDTSKGQQPLQLENPPPSVEQPQQTPLPPPYTTIDPAPAPAPAISTPCAEDGHDHDLDLFLSWPTNVNSFFDLGSAFNDPSILLNQVDFTQTLSPPSTDDSAEIQTQLLTEPGQPGEILCYADTSQFAAPLKETTTIFTDAWKRLIARYDKEFCILPLTKDFDANPFRHNLETSKGSQLLVHCILALCYKHINRHAETHSAEVAYHKQQAVQLLRDLEGQEGTGTGSASVASMGLTTVLDAVLILMTLDCATSAHGPWLSYLHRAHSVLEATEQLGIPRTPRMRAQIWMLAWWDVTLALTTRQGCVLSEKMIMSQFRSDDASTATTTTTTTTSTTTRPALRAEAPFYNISGCPEDLFKHMVQLGAYAREFELAATMECVVFNMEPVLDLERRIREWSVPEFEDRVGFLALGVEVEVDCCIDTEGSAGRGEEEGRGERGNEGDQGTIRTGLQVSAAELEELAHYRQDLHHCAEAWRYGLLLYIERVFKWRHSRDSTTTTTKPRNQPPQQTLMLSFLARKTLNNVTACRRTSSSNRNTNTNTNTTSTNLMLQKQLLLPVFLAGCETTDETLRQEAREYCIWWSEETGYDMFLTAAALLEEVWNCGARDSGSWWGGVIDGKTKMKGGGGAAGFGGLGGGGGVLAGSGGNQYLFG
ncbi:hypothetical protein BJY00DRAFT_311979 [Aspergillus carlsbadensis]|nr:hypothetical protein BJY00DRAFT_311979 [Aspergillus carlsbadensis]